MAAVGHVESAAGGVESESVAKENGGRPTTSDSCAAGARDSNSPPTSTNDEFKNVDVTSVDRSNYRQFPNRPSAEVEEHPGMGATTPTDASKLSLSPKSNAGQDSSSDDCDSRAGADLSDHNSRPTGRT